MPGIGSRLPGVLRWLGGGALVIGVAAATGFAIVTVFDGDAEPPPLAGDATPASPRPTESATTAVTGTAPAPTFTPDLPDLVIDAIFSRDNRLVVVVSNQGITDVTHQIMIAVGDGEARPADVKAGEPLHPGQMLELVLDDQFVQRRAEATVTVSTDPLTDEESLENNTRTEIVTPDRPNDLEIFEVIIVPGTGALRVTLRNNSPIPLGGTATLSVRLTAPDSTLLARAAIVLAIPPRGRQSIEFAEVVEPDLTRISVILATAAINDADPSNDVFPR